MNHSSAVPGRYQAHFSYLILTIGACFMIAAAFLLIQGLSRFSGESGSQTIFIVFGILFQVGESVCFIIAARQSHHSRFWRAGLLVLGIILFSFSISVMTLAQKASMQVGINAASAVDEKRDYLRSEIESLDRSINSYRFNAESQSKSIYKDSRALGQDSLNRTIDLEDKKRALSEQLFSLSQERRETSVDFFTRLESVVGWPAEATEFWFLVLRSLLIELCGVLFLAYGSYAISVLPAPLPVPEPTPGRSTAAAKRSSSTAKKKRKPAAKKSTATRKKARPKTKPEPEPENKPEQEPVTSTLREKRPDPTLLVPERLATQSENVFPLGGAKKAGSGQETSESKPRLSYDESAQAVIAAMNAGDLSEITRKSIKAYLSVGNDKADKILDMITDIQKNSSTDGAAGKAERNET